MEFQKFIPEGWEDTKDSITIEGIKFAKESGKILEGTVDKCDKNYNLHVNMGNGIYGIIPFDEVNIQSNSNDEITNRKICVSKIHSKVQFKITDTDMENNRFLLSRKAVGADVINWIKNDLKEGMVIDGIVKNIRPYGAFIDIGGGITGLMHIEDMSVSRIKSPEDRFNIGQKINVMIKCINKENNQVMLTYKELLGSWEDNVKEFQEGAKVQGIVRESDKYKNGIFIELKPNLVGMAEYKENLKYGQKVDVYIKRIIKDKKKIKLIII